MIKIYKYGEVPNNEIFARVVSTMNVEGIVADILQNVKTRGDEALKGYAEKFDGVRLDALEVAREEIDEAYDNADKTFVAILEEAASNIRAFHEKQVRQGFQIEKEKLTLRIF